jgi:alkylated DNA nucleotide flippase Atl1
MPLVANPGQTATNLCVGNSGLCRPRGLVALALLVPYHRVIRSDGDLGGYRWGLERKRELLARERAALAPEPADEAAA